jgi:hypothetical protein
VFDLLRGSALFHYDDHKKVLQGNKKPRGLFRSRGLGLFRVAVLRLRTSAVPATWAGKIKPPVIDGKDRTHDG